MKNFNSHIFALIPKLLLTAVILFLTACGDRTEPAAYLSVSTPAPHAMNKATRYSKFDNSELSLSRLVISVYTSTGKRIRSVNVLAADDNVRVEVPTNIELVVTGEAFVENTRAFEGRVFVDPIRPGQTAAVSLVLYDINNADSELQIDLGLNNAPANGLSKGLNFSRDNQFVLFLSNADNLIENDNNLSGDLFLKKFASNQIISLNSDALGNLGNTGVIQEVSSADISENGLYVVFASTANNLVIDDSNNVEDVFLKNTLTGEIHRISLNYNDNQVLNPSYDPQISDDGSIITFKSDAILEAEDNSGGLYVYNRLQNKVRRISGYVDNYVLSGDGEWLAFQHLVSTEGGESVQLELMEINGDIRKVIEDSTQHFVFSLSQNGQYLVYIPQEHELPSESLGKSHISARAISDDQLSRFFVYSQVTGRSKDVTEDIFGDSFNERLTQNNLPAISNDGRYLAFSYNNTIHVFNLLNKNLAQVTQGIDPFLSRDGRKIGFTRNQNLYLIDNPLFIQNSAPSGKALAPAGVNAVAQPGQINLSWQAVENASYYRIYQSSTPNIANGIDSGELIPLIYETTSNQIVITRGLVNGETTYLVVVAENEQGEGAFSQEVSAIALLDTIPPEVLRTVIPAETQNARLDNRIDVVFNEAIDVTASTILSYKLTDSLSQDVPFSVTNNNLAASLIPNPYLLFGETYQLEVNTLITDLAGNHLLEPYLYSFTTWAPSNEGSIEAPILISEGIHNGMVGTGSSFYRMDSVSVADYFYLNVLNSTDQIEVRASDFGFIDSPICSPCLIDMGEVKSSSVFIEANGSSTQRGAVFDIEIIPLVNYFIDAGINQNIGSLLDKQSFTGAMLIGLQPTTTYTIFFRALGDSSIDVVHLLSSDSICQLDGSTGSANYFCEFTSDEFGRIPLAIFGVNNIDNLSLTIQAQIIEEILFTDNFPTSFFLNNFTSHFYTVTGLTPGTDYAAIFQNNDFLEAHVAVFENTWQQTRCTSTLAPDLGFENCKVTADASGSIYFILTDTTGRGEGGANINVDIQPLLVPDTIAPQVMSIKSISVFENPSIDSRIDVNFSEAIAPELLSSGRFSISELGSEQTIGINSYDTSKNAVVTLNPDGPLLWGRTYNINVSTLVTDLAGNNLAVPFSQELITWAPSNEGFSFFPVQISNGLNDGMVGTGTSYYQLNHAGLFYDFYYVHLVEYTDPLNYSGDINFSASAFGFGGSSDCMAEANFCITDSIDSDTLSVEIDGSLTQYGAMYTMEYIPMYQYNPELGVDNNIGTLNDDQSSLGIFIGTLTANTTYNFIFKALGNSHIAVRSLLEDYSCELDGSVSAANYICEFTTDDLGRIALQFSGVANITNLEILVQIEELRVLQLSDFIIFESSSAFSTQYYKVTGLNPGVQYSHLVNLSDQSDGSFGDYAVLQNNWQEVVCAGQLDLNAVRVSSCTVVADQTGSLYFTLGASTQDYPYFEVNLLPVSAQQIAAASFQSFEITTQGDSKRFELTGLEPNSYYSVTLESVDPTFGVLSTFSTGWGETTCFNIQFNTATTCEALADSNGKLYMDFVTGFVPVEVPATMTMYVSINPMIVSQIALRDTLFDQQITPAAYTTATNLTPNMPYVVNVFNINRDLSGNTPYIAQPMLQILDDAWFAPSCTDFISASDRMACVEFPDANNEINFRTYDNIGLSGEIFQPMPTTANITVTPLQTVSTTTTAMPYAEGSVGINFALYAISGLGINVYHGVEITGSSGAVQFQVFADSSLNNELCTSNFKANSTSEFDQECFFINPVNTIYVLVDGTNTVTGANFTLNVYRAL